MKKFLLSIAIIVATALCLGAQNNEGVDLDQKYATEMLAKGTLAPDFTLTDITGREVKLSQFKGRKVVLQFWASWCPDCRAEVPHIKALQAKADPSEVACVAVSFDRTIDAFKTYVTENYMGGVQLYDPAGMKQSEVAKAYRVKWIPSLYLIDEEGKVSLATVMFDKLASALNAQAGIATLGAGLCTEEGCL
jgi:peroxiredoxin